MLALARDSPRVLESRSNIDEWPWTPRVSVAGQELRPASRPTSGVGGRRVASGRPATRRCNRAFHSVHWPFLDSRGIPAPLSRSLSLLPRCFAAVLTFDVYARTGPRKNQRTRKYQV